MAKSRKTTKESTSVSCEPKKEAHRTPLFLFVNSVIHFLFWSSAVFIGRVLLVDDIAVDSELDSHRRTRCLFLSSGHFLFDFSD